MRKLLAIFCLLLSVSLMGQAQVLGPSAKGGGVLRSKLQKARSGMVTVTLSRTPIKVKFELATASRVSIGAFKVIGSDTLLVRTLRSAVQTPAGIVTAVWDGKDDFGVDVPAGSNYVFIMESNNFGYQWVGVAGNTSFNLSNPAQMQKSFRRMATMYRAGTRIYFGTLYNEGHPSMAYFTEGSPQVRNNFMADGGTGQSTRFITSDGTRAYFFGHDYFSDRKRMNFGFAVNVSNNAEYTFTGGGQQFKTVQGQAYGVTYASALVVTDTSGVPDNTDIFKGAAVQKTGNYLFASLGAPKNLIRVWHKTTGAFVRDIAFTSVGALKIEVTNDTKLRAVVNGALRQYTINNTDGTLTDTGVVLPYLGKPMAMDISPDGNTLTVCDGDTSQKVKHYSISSNTLIASQGIKGGYTVSPNVQTDRFYFDDPNLVINDTYVCYQSDGSYWIGDDGNFRALHFSTSRTYVEQIAGMENCYTTGVDKNNPSRIFAQWFEFTVTDYDNPTTSWVLSKNYRATIPGQYFENKENRTQNVFQVGIFNEVITISGHTYAMIMRFSDQMFVIVELLPNAPVRFTGITLGVLTGSPATTNQERWKFLADGSVAVHRTTYAGGWRSAFIKRQFNGIDGSNNPILLSESSLETVFPMPSTDPFPIYGGSEPFGITRNGQVVTYNTNNYDLSSGNGLGYHLGGIKGGKFIWRGMMATQPSYKGEYPTDGAYDIGNTVNYGGGNVPVVGNDIYPTYHGENWKNAQVNKFAHFSNLGLYMGGFGVTNQEYLSDPVTYRGMAGNVFGATGIEAPNGNHYLVHGEEYGWSGIHFWKISNLNTRKRQVIAATVSNEPDSRGTPMFAALPRNAVLASGAISGFVRSPATDNGEYTVRTNALSYARLQAPDFYFQNNNSAGDKYATVPFNTQTGLTNWQVSFTLQATQYRASVGDYGQAGSGGGYIRILDNAGKILVQYYQKEAGAGRNVGFNGVQAASSIQSYVPITIRASGGSLICTYGNNTPVTVAKYDAAATLGSPAAIQVFSWIDAAGGSNTGRIYGILDAYFKPN